MSIKVPKARFQVVGDAARTLFVLLLFLLIAGAICNSIELSRDQPQPQLGAKNARAHQTIRTRRRVRLFKVSDVVVLSTLVQSYRLAGPDMPSISSDMSTNLEEYTSPEQHEQQTRSSIVTHTDHKSYDAYALPQAIRTYEKQFAPMYFNRLKALRSRVSHAAKRKWGEETVNGKAVTKKDKVLDIRPDEPAWVVGTIYMEMKYKPNILEDVSKGQDLDIAGVESYTDPDLDEMYLEDESGRILLEGDLLKEIVLVTGVVVGVLGMETKPGCFRVVDVVYPLTSVQKPTRDSTKKIALLSGLDFTGVWDAKHDLLVDYLSGELGYDSSDIARVIIAGNSVLVSEETTAQLDAKNKYGAKNKSNYSKESVTQLDQFLSTLLHTIPVDLMPGEQDPTEVSLPQQPLHPAFFQQSKPYLNTPSFRTITNPYWFQFNNLRILGTSGENINDIYKYTVPDSLRLSRINMLEATIHWQNIIPTAPDTLSCYPYAEKDPFTLTETPHVYFVGNQPQFETKLMHTERGSVRLISVPKFSETGSIVVLDTETLECELVTIDA